MVGTGMNRLGLSADDVLSGALDGVAVVTLMSHLACADEDVPMNRRQRDAFAALRGRTQASAMSLANSAGVFLGQDYAFDLTRPGLALYGGLPRADAEGCLKQVAFLEAQVIHARANASSGLNIGYADGYPRTLGKAGSCARGLCPVLGNVSMDLLAVDVTTLTIGEGDRFDVDFERRESAAAAGRSQYELLTGLGRRAERYWG